MLVRSFFALAVSAALLPAVAVAANGFSTNPQAVTLPGGSQVSGAPVPQAAASITQSTSNTITVGSSVSCNNTGLHTDMSYYRAFTLADFPQLDDVQFRVESVTVGIETVNDGGDVGQPMTVNLYGSTTNPPTLASLTPLATEAVTVPDSATGTLFNVNFLTPPALVVATDILVVEVFTPNGQADSHSFFIGSNPDGQSGPSFLRAADCGIAEITATASIGFPNMHIVMEVFGNTQVPVTLERFEVE